jgi:hypothetical protein
MENKLTIEHLAPYLPYGLEMVTNGDKNQQIWILGHENIKHALTWWKPLLIPLSELTLETFAKMVKSIYGWNSIVALETSGYFAVCEYITDEDSNNTETQEEYLLEREESDYESVISIRKPNPKSVFNFDIAYGTSDEMRYFMDYKTTMLFYNQLFANHFDFWNLIEKGLAINKLTLK